MYRFDFYFVCVAFSVCIARDAKLRPIDIPNQGKILGVEVSKLRVQKIVAFYGIPYAQPPVGSLRFAPPVTDSLPRWDDVKQDTDYPPSCLQSQEDFKDSEKPFLQLISKLNFTTNEDCLYLNIFTPYGEKSKPGFATIVWFHPGNFTTGSPAMWNPHTLVYRHRVIVVTVGWRLNIMGFFTSMDGEATGNFGLMDQQVAMQWVRNNIKLFGGDPDNITIMGYGTGGVSVAFHMINPVSKGLFAKAIVMSGNLFSSAAVKKPEEDKQILDKLADTFGCSRKPTYLLMQCLRNVDAQSLVDQTSNLNWSPLIDANIVNVTSPFIQELPEKYFEHGDFEKVPLLTGYTHMERVLEIENIHNISVTSTEYLKEFLTELVNSELPHINKTESSCPYNNDHVIDAVMFFYGPTQPIKDAEKFRDIIVSFVTEKDFAASTFRLANYMSKHQPTYMYRFDIRPSTLSATNLLPSYVSVPHLYDLIYIWGVPYWSNEIEWDIRDKRLSDIIMSFWTNFAKGGNPTENSIYPVTWNPFSEEDPGILFIDGTFNMSNSRNLNYKAFEFWNNYFPKVKDIAGGCCEDTDAGGSNMKYCLAQLFLPLLFVNMLLRI